jgi:hypothetical protein
MSGYDNHPIALVNGGTTVTLYTETRRVKNYSLVGPGHTVTQYGQSAMRDGSEVSGISYVNVDEIVDVRIQAGTRADNILAIESLERLVVLTKEYANTHRGNKTYLHFSPIGGTVRQSEILDLRVELDPDTLRYWNTLNVIGTISFTRRFYFEAVSPVGMTVVSPLSGSVAYGSYANLRNIPGSNHLHIAAAQVAGILETPPFIELKSNFASAMAIRTLYMWINIYNDPSNYNPLLEIEAGSVQHGGAPVADGGMSGGTYVEWAGANALNSTHSVLWRSAVIDATMAARMKGDSFTIMANMWDVTNLANDPTIQVKITRTTDYNVIWEGDLIRLGASLMMDLGDIPLPPVGAGVAPLGPFYIELWGSTAVGTSEIGIDYLYVVPARGKRILKQGAGNLPVGHSIYDNGYDKLLYAGKADDAAVGVSQTWYGIGEPIKLKPGMDARIYFLWDEEPYYNTTHTLQARLAYKDRYFSV